MEIKKINFASVAVRKAQPNFKGEEESQAVTQKSTNGTKNVVTALSLLAAIGAAGVAVYKHKNLDEAVEKAKKEAQKKIEEAEEKAKKAAEDAEKKIKEALQKAKQETKTESEKPAENTKHQIENKEPKLRQKEKGIKKPAVPEVKIDTEAKTEIKPEVKSEVSEVKPKHPKTKPEVKPEITVVRPSKSEVKQETTEVRLSKPEIKPEIPVITDKKPEIKPEKPSAGAVSADETKFTVEEERQSIKFLRKKFKNISKKLKKQKAIQTEKLITLNKSIDELGKAIEELKNAADNFLNKRRKPEVKPEIPAIETGKKPEVKPEIKPEIPVITDKKPEIKPEIKPEKQNIEADKPRIIRLEGGIKDSKLKKVDKKLLKRIKESKNGIIVIPRRTKLSEFVQKIQDYISRKISGLGNKSKEKTAWESEIEQDQKRYKKLVEKVKELNKKAEENKKYVAEFEKKLDGSITVTVPKKPTNFEHQELQKEYDKLGIKPEKRIHKTAEELKEQVAESWQKTAKSKVGEVEKQLDGSIAIAVPKKPTNFEHQELQKEYDKLGIKPEKRIHKTAEELKEQVAESWQKTAKSKVGEVEKQLDGSIAIAVPKKPTNFEHQELQKEYDKLGIKPEKRIHKTIEELKEQIADAWGKIAKPKVQGVEKKLDGSISVSVPEAPTKLEHQGLQKEYDKLAIKRKTTKSKPKAKVVKKSVRKTVRKTIVDAKEKLMSIWKKQSDPKVHALEKKLDGSISVSVPEAPTKLEHQGLQKEYDKLAIKRKTTKSKPKAKVVKKSVRKTVRKTIVDAKEKLMSIWKKQSDPKVHDLEKILNGNITVNIPRKTRKTLHQKLQNQLEKALGIKNRKQVTVKEAKETENRDSIESIENFNTGERMMAKYVYKHTTLPKDDVTKYPKLYADKEDRKHATKMILKYIRKYMWFDISAKKVEPTGNFWEDMHIPGVSPIEKFKEYIKLMQEEKLTKEMYKKAKEEHIARRVHKFNKHGCVGDAETAISNSYLITEDMKFHSKRYKSMLKERPRAEDWEPEMTREELMKDKYKYIQEAYRKERSY